MTDTKHSNSPKSRILVDFDGVIHSYVSGWQGKEVVADPPNEGAIDWLIKMAEQFQLCIFSTRCLTPEGTYAVKEWLNEHGFTRQIMDAWSVEFSDSKLPAILQIDDRAWQFNGQFPTADQIKSFKPYKPTL